VTRAIPFKSRAVRATRDIDYWGDGTKRHRLDVYRSRLAASGKAPVMVYIHGGAWMIGEKREQGKPMMYELVARGWVCVAINYRLSPKATWPDHIVDAKRAVAWVKEHIGEYGGDPDFVAVSGGSAGGHLCALLALSAGDPAFQPGFEEADTTVQAAVPFYGVLDLTSSPTGAAIFGPGLRKMLEQRVMKVQESAHPELFRAASPTYRVRAGAPPFFVLQGVNDTLVPVESARVFVERLRAVSRAPVAYAELPLAQHAFDVLASLRCQATTSAVGDFLEAARAAAGATDGHGLAPSRIVSDVESAPEL
jgi:acetyl esterase/lipase